MSQGQLSLLLTAAPLKPVARVRVSPGQDGSRAGLPQPGWASYVSIGEMARHGIGWPEIHAALDSDSKKMRAIGSGLLLGKLNSVLAYLEVPRERR